MNPELPDTLPVFPLPESVFFPSTIMPLHVFEPRYRRLTADALAGRRIIVMALLQPGWEEDYEGRPPIFPVACAGRIVHSHQLPDGRYYLTLKGLGRVRIQEEQPGGEYRTARVEWLPERREWLAGSEAGPVVSAILKRFQSINEGVEIVTEGADPADDADVRELTLNTMAMNLAVPAAARQSLLEIDDIEERARQLDRILGLALMERRAMRKFRHLAPDDPTVN